MLKESLHSILITFTQRSKSSMHFLKVACHVEKPVHKSFSMTIFESIFYYTEKVPKTITVSTDHRM